ncbi:MAG: class D sortase [Chloroflexi bacterium]|nr:class D sortase [Chloroflexota bacterium]
MRRQTHTAQLILRPFTIQTSRFTIKTAVPQSYHRLLYVPSLFPYHYPMSKQQSDDNLSVEELEQLLYRKKHALRRKRLQRLKEAGRMVDVAGLPPANPQPPALPRPNATPTGAMSRYLPQLEEDGIAEEVLPIVAEDEKGNGRFWLNRLLLLVEVGAVVGLLVVLFNLWGTQQELNQELAQAQQSQASALALPTPTAAPLIDLVVLPTGHRYVDGRSPEAVESGDIPAHLLPAVQAYQPPPLPTPGPEQARIIEIPAIGVNAPIVAGVYDWEQLKRGVGHHTGSALPGQEGNMVLAAHNDIYGEIFRDLSQLAPGDEFTISTGARAFTYVVTKIEIVEPTEVDVMQPTDHASATLISCYPYRINTQRIIVFADLKTDTLSS